MTTDIDSTKTNIDRELLKKYITTYFQDEVILEMLTDFIIKNENHCVSLFDIIPYLTHKNKINDINYVKQSRYKIFDKYRKNNTYIETVCNNNHFIQYSTCFGFNGYYHEKIDLINCISHTYILPIINKSYIKQICGTDIEDFMCIYHARERSIILIDYVNVTLDQLLKTETIVVVSEVDSNEMQYGRFIKRNDNICFQFINNNASSAKQIRFVNDTNEFIIPEISSSNIKHIFILGKVLFCGLFT